jgi:hypothetical protein
MTDTIDFLKTTEPNPQYLPPYSIAQGITAWRFSDLVRRHGYYRALWWAEFVRDRVPGIDLECTLLKTYTAFCEAEKNQTTS